MVVDTGRRERMRARVRDFFDDSASISTELACRRTAMAFQRTRLSAERTLMSVIRTSLSLISFGFTIYQFFLRLQEMKIVSDSAAPENFGSALIYLGVGMILIGILYHLQFMWALRRERRQLRREGLIVGEGRFPVSFTLLIALAVFAIGLAAVASVGLKAGPFH